MGGFQHRGELFVSKVGRGFLEALIQAPPTHSRQPTPPPQAVL